MSAATRLDFRLTHSRPDFVLFVPFCAMFFIYFFSLDPLSRGPFVQFFQAVFSKHALISGTILP